MALFASSALVEHAYPLLLLATSCLGIGFGLTVPALNTLAALYFPKTMDRAVLILNTLLGLGTALAPLLTSLFIGFHIWWGLPLLLAILILLLLLFSFKLHFLEQREGTDRRQTAARSFLAIRRFRPPLWSDRNGEWQLGDPLHEKFRG